MVPGRTDPGVGGGKLGGIIGGITKKFGSAGGIIGKFVRKGADAFSKITGQIGALKGGFLGKIQGVVGKTGAKLPAPLKKMIEEAKAKAKAKASGFVAANMAEVNGAAADNAVDQPAEVEKRPAEGSGS